MQEMRVPSLGWESTLEKEIATHSSVLAWGIPEQRSLVGYSPWGHKRVVWWLNNNNEAEYALKRKPFILLAKTDIHKLLIRCFSFNKANLQRIQLRNKSSFIRGYFYLPLTPSNTFTFCLFRLLFNRLCSKSGSDECYHPTRWDSPSWACILRKRGMPWRHAWDAMVN